MQKISTALFCWIENPHHDTQVLFTSTPTWHSGRLPHTTLFPTHQCFPAAGKLHVVALLCHGYPTSFHVLICWNSTYFSWPLFSHKYFTWYSFLPLIFLIYNSLLLILTVFSLCLLLHFTFFQLGICYLCTSIKTPLKKGECLTYIYCLWGLWVTCANGPI